ncbi:hypothetical protein ACS0TY_019424 [Phlomoides rotata]
MEESKPQPESRKRSLEQSIQDSPYFKMRVLVRDLRPHFIEVLKTPDFRNCQAADEIRQGMNQLMELYREWTSQSVKLAKCSNGDVSNGRKPAEHQQNVKDDVVSVPLPDNLVKGTYIVGGSAFGWNFITFHGNAPVYYGITKEAFRATNPKSG